MTDVATADGQASLDPGQRWALLRATLATAMLFTSMAIVPPSVDALVRERFALGNEDVSWFYVIHSMPQLVLLGLIVGLISDRLGRRVPLILAGGVSTALCTMLIPFMPSFGSLLALRFIDGATGILAIGLLMTRALDMARGSSAAGAMALYLTSIPLGYLTGSFLVARMGEEGVAHTFLFAGVLLLAAMAALAMDLRRPEPIGERTPTLPAIWRSLRSRPAVLWPCFFGMVDKFTFGLITVLTALALKDEFGLSAVVWGGSALGMLWIGFLLASAMAGALVRRVGPWVTVAIGSAGYGIALSLLLYWDSPRAFVALLTAAGAFVAIQTLPTYTLIGQLAGAESRATATAGFNVLGSYGLMAGIIFAGIASTRIGYPATFMVGGVVELLSAAIALFLRWRFVPLKAPVLANAQTATPPPLT